MIWTDIALGLALVALLAVEFVSLVSKREDDIRKWSRACP